MLCVVHGKLLLRDVSRGAVWRDLTVMLWWLWCLQTIKGHDFQVVYVAPGVQGCQAVPGPGLETQAATLGGVNQDSEQQTSPYSCFLPTKSSVLIQTIRQSLQPLNAQGNAQARGRCGQPFIRYRLLPFSLRPGLCSPPYTSANRWGKGTLGSACLKCTIQ